MQKWLLQKKRFHMHFTPTSASWLNMVERFFADLTGAVCSEIFASVEELTSHIISHLAEHNLGPTAYRWRADGARVLEKIIRARAKLAEVGANE